ERCAGHEVAAVRRGKGAAGPNTCPRGATHPPRVEQELYRPPEHGRVGPMGGRAPTPAGEAATPTMARLSRRGPAGTEEQGAPPVTGPWKIFIKMCVLSVGGDPWSWSRSGQTGREDTTAAVRGDDGESGQRGGS